MTTDPRTPIDLGPYTLEMPTAPLCWAQVFANHHPVELEIGPGKGLFLANAAARKPQHNFLGVEMAHKYARRAAERAAKQALTNVRVVAGDGRRLLALFVPPASLRALHIYFPDPWWKKRHKKRRVFCEPFVADVSRSLEPAGHFWIATDVEEYFGAMLEILSRRTDFDPQPPPEPNSPEHDLDYLTNFERKYRIEGRPIFRAHYRVNARAAPTGADLPSQ
jgi:tRNA (guanine-N7-)-methyltransferase